MPFLQEFIFEIGVLLSIDKLCFDSLKADGGGGHSHKLLKAQANVFEPYGIPSIDFTPSETNSSKSLIFNKHFDTALYERKLSCQHSSCGDDCSFSIHCLLYEFDGPFFIFYSGTHSKDFKPRDSALPRIYLSTTQKQRLYQFESYAEGTTPGAFFSSIIDNDNETHKPTRDQIANALSSIRKLLDNKHTEAKAIREYIRSNKEFILYPRDERDISEVYKPEKEWVIVIASKWSLDRLQYHGQDLFGLDSYYKAIQDRCPVWALVTMNELNQSEPTAFIIARSGTSASLQVGLLKILDQVRQSMPAFSPRVMIDKDLAERLALHNLGLVYILCQFHVLQALHKEIGKRNRN